MKKLWPLLFKSIVWLVLTAFTWETLGLQPLVWSQDFTLSLPAPGTMVKLSAMHDPVLMKGIKIYPDNPFRFDFLMDPGNEQLAGKELEKESGKLVKYFLAALTVPDQDKWVNLSPYEKNRITPQAFGETEMGRDLLAQDYLLKQISASLLNPATPRGEEFWKKIYSTAHQFTGNSFDAINSLNKVWIVPDYAQVYTIGDQALVTGTHLKVMLDQDYQANQTNHPQISSQDQERYAKVIREVLIPAIEKDVNEGENFVLLRQIYYSMILATWFKKHLRKNIFSQMYVGQNKVSGVDVEDKTIKEKIYEQYLEAFKKGAFNFIREDYDEQSQEVVPHKYFAGGITFMGFGSSPVHYQETTDPLSLRNFQPHTLSGKAQRQLFAVSSAVVNPNGVNWYTRAISHINNREASSSSSVMSKFLERNILPNTNSKIWTRFLLSMAGILAAMSFSHPLQAAEYSLNSQHDLVVQVQKGDTLGGILTQVKRAQTTAPDFTAQGQNKVFNTPVWGANGLVNAMAHVMGVQQPEKIVIDQVLTIPAQYLTDAAKAQLVSGNTKTRNPGEPRITLTADAQQSSMTADFTAGVFGLGPIGSGSLLADLTSGPLWTPQESSGILPIQDLPQPQNINVSWAQPYTENKFDVLSNQATVFATLFSLPLGVPIRNFFLAQETSFLPNPGKKPESQGLVNEAFDQGISAEDQLVQYMTGLSLPLITANDDIKAKISSLTEQMAESLVNHLITTNPALRKGKEDIKQAFAIRFENGLNQIWQGIFNQSEVDSMIRLKAKEFAVSWLASGTADFTDDLALNAFLIDLDQQINGKIAVMEHLLNANIEIEPVVKSIGLAQVALANAQGQKADVSLIGIGTAQQIINTLAQQQNVQISGLEPKVSFNLISAKTTPGEIEVLIAKDSKNLKTIDAKIYREAVLMAQGIVKEVQKEIRRLRMSQRGKTEAALNKYLVPVLVRYFLTAIYQNYNARMAEDLIKAKAREISTRLKQRTLSPENVSREISQFNRVDLKPQLTRLFAEAIGVVQNQYIVTARPTYINSISGFLYEVKAAATSFEGQVHPQWDQNVIAQGMAERLNTVLSQGLGLEPMPVILSALAMKAAEQKQEQKPEEIATEPVTEPQPQTSNYNPLKGYVKYHWVDTAVLLTTAAAVSAFGQMDLQGLLTTLVSPLVFRSGLTASYALHEWSHYLVSGPKAWTENNFRANTSYSSWLQMLIPFFGSIPTDLHVQSKESKIWAWINRLAGVTISTAVALTAGWSTKYFIDHDLIATAISVIPAVWGTVLVWMGAVKEDLYKPISEKPCDDKFGCGVVLGMMKRTADDTGIFPDRAAKIGEEMGEVTDIRGRQAAGFYIKARDRKGRVRFIGGRHVNSKRGDLPKAMSGIVRQSTILANAKGYTDDGAYMTLQAHYRYGTSSAPRKVETHPHQWVDDRDVRHWKINSNVLESDTETTAVTVQLPDDKDNLTSKIVHNGDFDYWRMNGHSEPYDNKQMGHWLTNVLHTQNSATGDSPKVAGMMDFLITQGMFDASARYAYYQVMATEFADVFGGEYKIERTQDPKKLGVSHEKVISPNTALSMEDISQLEQRFHEVLSRHAKDLMLEHQVYQSLSDFWPKEGEVQYQAKEDKIKILEDDAVKNLRGLDLIQTWSDEQRHAFVRQTLKSFFTQGTFEAIKIFQNRAIGSFGLGVVTTLDSGFYLLADGQPLTMAWDDAHTIILTGSEAKAVQVSVNDQGAILDRRYTLDQTPGAGEIVHVDKAGEEITVYSVKLGRNLTEEEFAQRTIPLKGNTKISPLPDMSSDDWVGDDVRDTAHVSQAIHADWQNPDSGNRQTQRNFMGSLLALNYAKRISRQSMAFVSLEAKVHKKVTLMVEKTREQWSDNLKSEGILSPESSIAQKEVIPYVSMLEGIFAQMFPVADIQERIHAQATHLTQELIHGRIDVNQFQVEINRYIDKELNPMIDATFNKVLAHVRLINQRWQKAILANLKAESMQQGLRTTILPVRVNKLSSTVPSPKVDMAKAFARALAPVQKIFRESGIKPGFVMPKPEMDLIVTGVENNLWVGEQFVHDLKLMFPELTADAKSSNNVLDNPRASGIGRYTVVLAISHSGQTFSTLNTVINVEKLNPGRTYALTGELDTLMAPALGQELKPESSLNGHIFINFAGFRPSEAVSLTTTATKLTLNELLLAFGRDILTLDPMGTLLGMKLKNEQLDELSQESAAMSKAMALITGVNENGKAVQSSEDFEIERLSQRWTQHVLDEPVSKAISIVHLTAAVVGGFLLFPFLAKLVGFASGGILVLFAQLFFFLFFQYSTVLIRRAINGREIFARTGKRTIVIGDQQKFVAKSLEIFLSKMNALSKSGTAVDVHSGDPTDHFVHEFGHRVVRGTLLLLGMPDARKGDRLSRMLSSVMMTGKQAKGVQNFGVGAEVVSIGATRSHNANATDTDITVTDQNPVKKSELSMFYEGMFDSTKRLVAGQVLLYKTMRKVSTLGLKNGLLRKFWWMYWDISRTQSGPRIATTAAPVANNLGALTPKTDVTVPAGLKKHAVQAPGDSQAGKQVSASSSIRQKSFAKDVGGIDMSSARLQLREFGSSQVNLPDSGDMLIDPKILHEFPQDRFVPYILDVTVVNSPEMFLGINKPVDPLLNAAH